MEFEWDEAKQAANVAKHGFGFELAAAVFTDEGRVEGSARQIGKGSARGYRAHSLRGTRVRCVHLEDL